MNWEPLPRARFQVLCLAGGGFRGLYTARVLELLEARFERSIASCFDLIGGTSVGGVIALALAAGRSAGEVRESIERHGPDIFGSGGWFARWLSLARLGISAKHDGARLRALIESTLSVDLHLAELQRSVVVPAVSLTTGSVEIFRTPHCERAESIGDSRLVDVAMATTAAPLFFAPARVSTTDYVDGGMIANSPDLLALHEAETILGRPVGDVFMLSVGTTFPPDGSLAKRSHSGSLPFWLKDHRLVELNISAQQSLVNRLCGERLGDRYLVVNWPQSYRQSRHLAMDLADQTATETLRALADASTKQALQSPALHAMLAHQGMTLAQVQDATSLGMR